ncbi:hypothetical protein TVAG_345410 [Trichomonas vaginalis G3]|uniref:DUF3447 domain-containing protein n=1 Tax=Trichomonas vaginalis (strain ATCC PRA-98 / G3) TaxID=412133 RepID=A2EW19_TRIV3|nr:proteasome regulatory particle assembly [Trichomonas vaginalis G3]EAY03167.1 hypothetical protein TVAG_345410 [Trichomonas vaginalis G3]KAI5545453.1 proteasome regulatory particle assembly [Trichomonas vaginalis G3]|eukprot:XP_001315390.1 hypothetical protein [Trichomonas vaginalis G3]
MSDQNIHPKKYDELRSNYKYYIDSFNALYQLNAENEEEINSIYKKIKTELIDSMKYLPQNIIRDIFDIVAYNNRYLKSYLTLAKLIFDDYHVKDVDTLNILPKYLFYKEYGIKLGHPIYIEEIKFDNLEICSENTIFRAIMYDNKESFIHFMEVGEFDETQILRSDLYPYSEEGYSLLELCCYNGSVDCFKLLRTKFKSPITQKCLEFSFLGGNPEIMSECLKYQKPDEFTMKHAIISHNIDFVSFLMNEHNIDIDLSICAKYKNLESFLVYFDQTNGIDKCFVYSIMFNIPSILEYFFSQGANINEKDENGETALHNATIENNEETVEFLITHGANINEKNENEETALHYAATNNCTQIAEFLILHGANINEKDKKGKTALHNASIWNCKETADLLILLGANIDEKDDNDQTDLHYAIETISKETIEFLIS